MLDSIAIERYEQYLLGKRRLSLNGSAFEKEVAAKAILHYAVADLLEWTPEQAEEHMTQKIITDMKLDRTFKYIHFPPDIEPEKDFDYIACLAYPSHPYNIRKQILRIYNRILTGQDERFPKKVFDGSRGREKGAILLNEFIANNLSVSSIEELYEMFSDMPKMNYRFRKAKIYAASRKLYATPLDFLHHSLSDEERDDFLYAFWQYKNISKIAELKLDREKDGKDVNMEEEDDDED